MILVQLRQQFYIASVQIVCQAFQTVVLVFTLGTFCSHCGGCLLCAFGLAAIVLSFDVCVESGIREVAFAAAALEVSAFFILSGAAGGRFLELEVIKALILIHVTIIIDYKNHQVGFDSNFY